MAEKRLRRISLAHIVWFSIVAAILTIILKFAAYIITGSVGFMSDAIESIINLAAALIAYITLIIAARPADTEHPFGHDKAEYFSSLVEGTLILIAAAGILYAAINRILNPIVLKELNIGIVLSAIAAIINLISARFLLFYGKKYTSITLEADAHHLMTDVWTTVGIIVGLLMVNLTNWQLFDPLIAILVGLGIVLTGIRLIMHSVSGLMDTKLSEKELNRIRNILNRYKKKGFDYHALYTRKASSKRFITFHLLFPGEFSIHHAHEISKKIESEITLELPYSDVFVHLESMNDPDSFDDEVHDSELVKNQSGS